MHAAAAHILAARPELAYAIVEAASQSGSNLWVLDHAYIQLVAAAAGETRALGRGNIWINK